MIKEYNVYTNVYEEDYYDALDTIRNIVGDGVDSQLDGEYVFISFYFKGEKAELLKIINEIENEGIEVEYEEC